MARDIALRLTATDQVSPALTKIGSVATQADGQLKAFDSSLNKAGTTADRFSKVGASVGAAIGAMTGILADAARASAEAEVSQQRLEASIEATGHMYEEYADQLKRAGDAAVQMSFDDEDAADAISFLTQATGDASAAINDLGLVMDIARARGIDLAAAAKIVAAAEQERFGQLARIGIQLDENSTKEEAIAALQQKYAGQAAAYAETNIGFIDRLQVKYENAMEALGDYTGGVQQLLILLPGLSAGFTAAAAAAGAFNATLLSGAGRLTALIGPLGGVALGLAAVGYMLANPAGTGIGEDVPYFEYFQREASLLQVTLGRVAAKGSEYQQAVGEQSASIIEDLAFLAQRQHEIQFLRENDLDASTQQLNSWAKEQADITARLGQELSDNSAYYLANLTTDVNAIMGYTGAGAALAQAHLADLNDEFKSGYLSPLEYASQVDIAAASLADFDEEAANTVHSTDALTDSTTRHTDALYESNYAQTTATDLLRGRAIVVQAVADAEEQLTNQYNLTTSAYRATTDAQAAGFRIAVQNTNAIAQQSQAVADWGENLIGAQGEYSTLDDLVNAGRISGKSGEFEGPTQYAAAQRAYNSILEDNAAIQEHILTIQAKQAPTLAAMADQQERYLAGVANGTAEEQMRALAYMDSATSAQALQLAQGYLENRDVFGPMIVQAAALDPYLATILEDMGIISRDHEGNITLTGADDAKSKLDILTEAIQALVQAEWVASFDGDVSAAEHAYEVATGLLVDWDGSEGTADLNINDNATTTLSDAIGLLNGFDGRYALSTIEIQTINTTLNPFADGGTIPRMANGGIPVMGAEHGIELVKRASGGAMLMTTPGVYNLSAGDQVFHAGATRSMLGAGGLTVNINIDGAGVMGDAQARELAQLIVPAFMRALEQAETEMVA